MKPLEELEQAFAEILANTLVPEQQLANKEFENLLIQCEKDGSLPY